MVDPVRETNRQAARSDAIADGARQKTDDSAERVALAITGLGEARDTGVARKARGVTRGRPHHGQRRT